MGSTLKVDNIVGTSGTSAPITLSGDTATLSGTGVTFPTGHVLRVFYQVSTGSITVTSGTTIVTGVTQTLTPLSDTSKFLIMFSCNGRYNSGTDTTFQVQVYYGGSAIGGIANMNQNNSDTNSPCSGSGSFLHSPSVATEITYDIRLALTFGSGSFGLDSGHSHMTIMEVQG
tara:strand:- start:115 stop:630 length:516 start_codon:yes stop_codon:yes gene_type:complete